MKHAASSHKCHSSECTLLFTVVLFVPNNIVLQVLERISFLLRSPAALSATTPLLVILQSYMRAGADAARAVWGCPGMQKALKGLLQGPAGSLPLHRAAELSASALSIVRLLAASDTQLFTAVIASGSPLCTTQQEGQSSWLYC